MLKTVLLRSVSLWDTDLCFIVRRILRRTWHGDGRMTSVNKCSLVTTDRLTIYQKIIILMTRLVGKFPPPFDCPAKSVHSYAVDPGTRGLTNKGKFLPRRVQQGEWYLLDCWTVKRSTITATPSDTSFFQILQ